MVAVLLIIHLFVTLALIGIVLIQRSEGGGLGIGSSQGMGSFMSGRGTANLLTRTTGILATAFMALSLALALLNRGTGGVGRSILAEPPPGAHRARRAVRHRRPRRPPPRRQRPPRRAFPRTSARAVAAWASPRPAKPRIKPAHDAVCVHHRRRGLLARQRHRVGGARRAAASARLCGAAAQARSLPQRRSGHDEPVPARRSVRDRRRRGNRSRSRPLRTLHRRACDEVGQRDDGTHLRRGDRARATRRLSRRDGAGHSAHHRRDQGSDRPRHRRARFRAGRDRRHGRRHREPAVPRSHPPARQRSGPARDDVRPPDAGALHPVGG